MRRILLGVAFVLVLVVAGFAALRWHGAAIMANYKHSNIAIGAQTTANAEALCPQAGHSRLVCLAAALKARVSPELRAKLQRPYSVADARKWSNFPPVGYTERVGPTLGDFGPAELGIIKAMLREAAGIASDEGYDEMEQILNADDYLKKNTTDEAGFSSGNYHIAFLGEPAESGTWELHFGGHHMAFANTYKDGKLSGASPSFRGVEPFTRFEMNGRLNAPMAQEQAAFAAMLAALTNAERQQARLQVIFTDVVAGPQKDDNFPAKREGLRVGALNPGQQALVLSAIETYVADVSPQDAASIMQRYKTELGETYLAFSGSSAVNSANDYLRIDGPSVWIEFSLQPGRSMPGVHPHSVWRDRRSDYAGNK